MHRPAAFLASTFALGIVAGCGGAAPTDLLAAPGSVTSDDGGGGDATHPSSDGGRTDATADVGPPPSDTGANDSSPVVDVAPPIDSPPPDGVACGAQTCPATVADCCVDPNSQTYECQNPAKVTLCASAGNVPVSCDKGAQCNGRICCGTQDATGNYMAVRCLPSCNGVFDVIFCDPAASPPECPSPMACIPSMVLPPYNVCQ